MTLSDEEQTILDWNLNDQDYTQSSNSNEFPGSLNSRPSEITSENNLIESSKNDIKQASKGSNKMKITVTNPKKEIELQSQFISYLVVSTNHKVRRRFQDFVWLHRTLYQQYPAVYVPPLPDKHVLEYLKGGRFSHEFIARRTISLEFFLNRILNHPILNQSILFNTFLTSKEFNDLSAKTLRDGQETIIETMGDSLLNAFSKPPRPNPEFLVFQTTHQQLESNLDRLDRTLTKLPTDRLILDQRLLLDSLQQLDHFGYRPEPFLKGLEGHIRHSTEHAQHEWIWRIWIHDRMVYHQSALQVLRLRDQRESDLEDLEGYLDRTRIEKENPVGMKGFLRAKWNLARGLDLDRLALERSRQLDGRIVELEGAIEVARVVSREFSEQVRKEEEVFRQIQLKETHQALLALTDAKVDFYQKGVENWTKVIELLAAEECK